MIYKYLLVELFGIQKNINNGSLNEVIDIDVFKVKEFDKRLRNLNKIWVIQIFIAWLYCIKIRRFLPAQTNARISIFIKQFYIYLLTCSIVYFTEMLFSDTFYFLFERFAHHVVAILLFYSCYLKPTIISFCFLTPILLHSIYWLEIARIYASRLLVFYNLSILINSFIIMLTTYNRTTKLYSLRVLILSGLLLNVNMFGARYGFSVNLFELDYEKAKESLIFSLTTSSPLYFYLIYVNYEKLTKLCRIRKPNQVEHIHIV